MARDWWMLGIGAGITLLIATIVGRRVSSRKIGGGTLIFTLPATGSSVYSVPHGLGVTPNVAVAGYEDTWTLADQDKVGIHVHSMNATYVYVSILNNSTTNLVDATLHVIAI